jgi:hypothetical protein
MRFLPVVLLVGLLIGGCSSTGPSEPVEEDPPDFRPPPLARDLPSGQLHRTSRPATFLDMLEDLAEVDIVYVGGERGNADHELLQEKVVEYLLDRGRLDGVGLAAFERRHQAALDDYVEKRIGDAELMRRTGAAAVPPVLLYARRQTLRVTALGVDGAVAEAVAAGGLDALTAEQRDALPATSPETLADDVVADGIVEWFRTRPDDAQIVVIAATGRVAPRAGLPEQVHGRNGKSYRTVVPVGADPAAAEFAQRHADYVWVARAP